MRALKLFINRFLPEETHDQLNQAPWMKYVALTLMLIIGPLLIYNGAGGVKRRAIVSKGREYTGALAIVMGSLYAITGLVMVLGALAIVFVMS